MAGVNTHFEFRLNDTVLQDEPKGWDKAQIVIERDPVLKGVFINYMEELEFIGDGYDVLQGLIDSDGYCREVSFELYEVDHNGHRIIDGLGYKGIIDLSQVVINRRLPSIKASIENESLSYLLKKYRNLKVPINQTGATLNGETLADIGQSIFFQWPISITAQAEYVGNIMEYLISYISDNRIDFVSDWFTTQNFYLKKIRVTYAADATLNEVENITYTNIYGETVNVSITYVLAQYQAWQRFMAHSLCFQTPGVLFKRFDEYNHKQLLQIQEMGTGTALEVPIYDLHDFEFTTDRASTITVLQEFSDGGANCAMVIGANIKGNEQEMVLSFEDIFKVEDGTFNLMCVFTIESGRAKIRIEPESYFYQNTALITLSDIDIIEEKTASDLIYKTFNISAKVNDAPGEVVTMGSGTFGVGTFKIPIKPERSLIFEGCGEKDKNIDINVLCYNASQFAGFSEKDIFLFESSPAGLDFQVKYNTQSVDTVGGLSYQIIMSQICTLHALPILIAKRHLGVAGINALYAGDRISSNNIFQLQREVKFNAPITLTQLKQILATPYYFFDIEIPNANGGHHTFIKRGYIKKMSYGITTGIANFELYTA
jgi:hypothetical protein